MINREMEILRTESKDVKAVIRIQDTIERLEKEVVKHKIGVGLAAIQIGRPERIGVIRHKGGFVHLINPVLVERAEPFVFLREGCLSLPGTLHNTRRWKDVTIDNMVIDGRKLRTERQNYQYEWQTANTDTLLAIAVQHELDHFNGRLITDYNEVVEPVQSIGKVGRNEPCICGSGRKYKKCCLSKD